MRLGGRRRGSGTSRILGVEDQEDHAQVVTPWLDDREAGRSQGRSALYTWWRQGTRVCWFGPQNQWQRFVGLGLKTNGYGLLV